MGSIQHLIKKYERNIHIYALLSMNIYIKSILLIFEIKEKTYSHEFNVETHEGKREISFRKNIHIYIFLCMYVCI